MVNISAVVAPFTFDSEGLPLEILVTHNHLFLIMFYFWFSNYAYFLNLLYVLLFVRLTWG